MYKQDRKRMDEALEAVRTAAETLRERSGEGSSATWTGGC